jgi:hypothetical protein
LSGVGDLEGEPEGGHRLGNALLNDIIRYVVEALDELDRFAASEEATRVLHLQVPRSGAVILPKAYEKKRWRKE